MTLFASILTVDIDMIRFVIIASVVVGAMIYARLGLTAGGTLTGGYLTILCLQQRWGLIVSLAVATAIAYVVVRWMLTRFLPLPKPWIFLAFVVTSAISTTIIHLAFHRIGSLELPGGLEIYLTVGSYITPGLIAYDLAHQGFRPTGIGLGLGIMGTLAIVVPIVALANWWRPQTLTVYLPPDGNIPDGWFWLAALSSAFMACALRASFAVRSAGFIGAVFLVEFLTPEAFITVAVAATAASLVVRGVRRLVVLTPRQRFEVAMLTGAMFAWTGLYWGAQLGWVPAEEANNYALEPLVVVGLLASDMGRSRSSTLKVFVGLAVTVGFVWVVVRLASSGDPRQWILSGLILLGIPALLFVPGVRSLRREWRNAIRLGFETASLHRNP